jgi:hypothetical protein
MFLQEYRQYQSKNQIDWTECLDKDAKKEWKKSRYSDELNWVQVISIESFKVEGWYREQTFKLVDLFHGLTIQ